MGCKCYTLSDTCQNGRGRSDGEPKDASSPLTLCGTPPRRRDVRAQGRVLFQELLRQHLHVRVQTQLIPAMPKTKQQTAAPPKKQDVRVALSNSNDCEIVSFFINSPVSVLRVGYKEKNITPHISNSKKKRTSSVSRMWSRQGHTRIPGLAAALPLAAWRHGKGRAPAQPSRRFAPSYLYLLSLVIDTSLL
ncbi:hypothetical protein J6590_086579 [Homalodisca vitripennis]|nr:hypothetical protein J6590_086579 [Homalodisca vitripennis]